MESIFYVKGTTRLKPPYSYLTKWAIRTLKTKFFKKVSAANSQGKEVTTSYHNLQNVVAHEVNKRCWHCPSSLITILLRPRNQTGEKYQKRKCLKISWIFPSFERSIMRAWVSRLGKWWEQKSMITEALPSPLRNSSNGKTGTISRKQSELGGLNLKKDF